MPQKELLKRVVLRDERDQNGSRYLSASFSDQGDLVFAGQDLGKAVEEFFGESEYEWFWTVRMAALPALAAALAATLSKPDDLLLAVQQRFSGNNAAEIGPFLEQHQIPCDKYSC